MSAQRSAVQFDDVFGYIGECGRYQIWHYLLVCFCGIFVSMHIYLNTFTYASPSHRCLLHAIPNDAYDINATSAKGQWIDKLIPKTDTGALDSCHMFNYSGYFPNITINSNSSPIACSEWVHDKTNFQHNVVTQLQLFCNKNDWVTFANSMIFVGALIGSFIIGDFSDRFGRHKAFMFSSVGMLASGCGAAYMKTYWGILALRMVSVALATGLFMTAFVLSVEMMGPSMRTYAGIIIEFFFAGGSMLLALMAYYLRDWVWLQLAASVPMCIFLLYFFLIDESCRWLLLKGDGKAFERGMEKMARWNRKEIPREFLSELADSAVEMRAQNKNTGSFIDIFRYPNIALKSVNIFLGWLVNTMLYYGITMHMTALPGSPFLLVVISGGVEIPAYLFCLLCLNRLGRRTMTAGSMILAGIACFPCPFIADGQIVTGLAIAGKFFTSIAFAVIYIFTAELFPTCIRTSGIGLSSLCARIGGIVFPIIIGFFDGRGHPEIPMLVFGVVSLVSGTLTAFLPETLNKVLPETLEQADEFGRPKCCGGRGTGRNEGAPLLGGGLAGNLLRPGEGRSLLGDDEDDDDELFSTNTLT